MPTNEFRRSSTAFVVDLKDNKSQPQPLQEAKRANPPPKLSKKIEQYGLKRKAAL